MVITPTNLRGISQLRKKQFQHGLDLTFLKECVHSQITVLLTVHCIMLQSVERSRLLHVQPVGQGMHAPAGLALFCQIFGSLPGSFDIVL